MLAPLQTSAVWNPDGLGAAVSADLLAVIGEQAAQVLGTPHVCIYLVAGPKEQLRRLLGAGRFDGRHALPASTSRALARVAQTGRALIGTPGPRRPAGRQHSSGVGPLAAVPLPLGRSARGVLAAAWQPVGGHLPGDAEVQRLHGFARQAALAIEHGQLYASERRAREQADRLRSATQALSRSMELREIFDLILSELSAVVPYDSASIQELRCGRLVMVGGRGFSNLEELLGVGFDVAADDNPNREVVRSRAALVLGDAPARYPNFARRPHAGAAIRSWLGVPLVFADRVLGMLALDKRQASFYTAAHAELAASFAAQAAIAIENARLYAAARKADAEWRLTFDAIGSLILVLDGHGEVVRLNLAARQLCEAEAGHAVEGLGIGALGTGEPWRAVREIVNASQLAQCPRQLQVRDEAFGRTWDVASALFPGPEPAESRIVVVARDITPFVQLQESLHRAETVGALARLVAGVAHEVRTPLFGISATIDALKLRLGPAAWGEHFRVLETQLERLRELISALLDYARPARQDWSAGALADVVREAQRSLSELARRADVQVRVELPSGLPELSMNRLRLVQAFQHLIENAVQHSPPRATVTVEAKPVCLDGQPWVRCEVEDAGPGIDAEDLTRIFEPFYTRRRGGAGLGLSIVQRIVEEHGGRTWAEPRAQRGALLVVMLPGR